MKTETILETVEVERAATLSLVRMLDLDAVAKAHPDGSIPVEALKNAGDFVVRVNPTGKQGTFAMPMDSKELGEAWIEGFAACAKLRKRKPYGSKRPKAMGAKNDSARDK